MNDREALQMMRRSCDEIISLRKIVEALTPRAEAYQTIRQILSLMPHQETGMSEDLVWRLEKRIAEMKKSMDEEKVVASEERAM